MKLFLIEQSENAGYDTYNSAVVYAYTEEQAQQMHPRNGVTWDEIKDAYLETYGNIETAILIFYNSWAKPENVKVTYLGLTTNTKIKPGVICASFNAN